MRHAITRMIIGLVLAGVGIFGVVTGRGSDMGLCIAFGLLYCGSALMLIKKNKSENTNK